MFYDRKEELKALMRRLASDKFELVIIYGRRRIGKSTLALEALKRSGAKSVYYIATESGNLKDFRLAASANFPAIGRLREDWGAYLEELKNAVVVFDEFPNMLIEDRNVTNLFQRSIDTGLKGSKTKLVLLGSSISMMEGGVLSYKSPLYGRKTSVLRLFELDVLGARLFFPGYGLREVIEAYGFAGGIPFYLEKIEMPFWKWLDRELSKPDTFIKTEVDFLLKYEFKNLGVYKRILEAIAMGKTKLNEIRDYAGTKGQLTSYLSNLINVGIVEKRNPIFSRAGSKLGRYYIKDNFINFWFRFVAQNLSLIESGAFRADSIREGYAPYMGVVFEKIAEGLLLRLSKRRAIFELTDIGRYWGRRPDKRRGEDAFDIDVVAANRNTVEIAFFEVKWRDMDEKEARNAIKSVRDRSGFLDWHNGSRRELFGIVARSIGGKERLRKEGYLAYDLDDL